MTGTKAELRKLFLEKRNSLSTQKSEELDQKILDHFISYFTIAGFGKIHPYLPMKKANEIDTYKLIGAIREIHSDIEISAPRMSEKEYKLDHYRFGEPKSLETNKWGIPEPPADRDNSIEIGELDMVIVPLLAFDISGHRVGYGKGYYDRFLAACEPGTLKVGLSRFDPVELIVDSNEHDVKLSACVTPETVYTF